MRAGIVLVLLILMCSFAQAATGDRVALVIGNAAYQNGALRNPANDAADVSAKLKSLGFEVVSGTNLDRDGMFRKVQEFRSALKPGGVGLFFYSGHGVEVAGRNYLLPVNNAVIRTVEDVEIHGFEAQRLVSQMEAAGTQLNVVILDACRDNPLPSTVRSASKGLGRMDAQQGTLIAYATKEGQVAADGSGRNSPYTQALLKHLGEPGLEVSQLFNRVGLEVSTSTRGVQVPWVSSSPVPPVMLAGVGTVVQPSPAVPAGEGELRIEVNPAGATVRLDGVLLGTGSRSVRQASGKTVLVRAEATGHEALEERVLIQGGQVADVVLRLKPLAGASQPDPVMTPPEAAAVSPVPSRAMVEVPAGSFQMGSPSHEVDRQASEGPAREVKMKAFRLGKYEVTRGEFARFVDDTNYRTDAERNSEVPDVRADRAQGPNPGCWVLKSDGQWGWAAGSNWRDPGLAQGDDHPVVCVSWNDAWAYIEWLNRETGRRYRLPSEAEQEYAIRAFGPVWRPYAWGSDVNGACEYANVADQSGTPTGGRWNGGANCNDGSKGTAPVGRFRANGFGLHDTMGNVWEWGQDCYMGSYQDAPVDGRAVEANGCGVRVLRGAAWDSVLPAGLRSAYRAGHHPAFRTSDIGFRLAEDL